MSYFFFRFSVEHGQDTRLCALGVKTELVWGTGAPAQERGQCKSVLEGFSYGHDSDTSLTLLLLQCGRLSLPCVFSCEKETQK